MTSSFQNNFPDDAPPENVTYYSIYETGVLTPVELIVAEIGRNPFVWYDVLDTTLREGDGTVPELSARLDFGERAKNIPLTLGIRHIDLVNAPEVQAEVLRALRE